MKKEKINKDIKRKDNDVEFGKEEPLDYTELVPNTKKRNRLAAISEKILSGKYKK